MRQVPRYLLIGNGRVARHFQYYFSLLQIPFETWHRKESFEKLQQQLKTHSHILLLINDKAIDDFIFQHRISEKKIWVHFSGSLVSELAYGVHPLMTFGHDLYSLEIYQRIPFIVDHDALDFKILFPALSNQHVRLQKSLKAKYHALCVLSGNFSCILWQKLFSSLEDEFNIPHDMAHSYLQQQTQNLLRDFKSSLTGPLVRNDIDTIENNLSALDQDPFQDVYKSFVSCYQKLMMEK